MRGHSKRLRSAKLAPHAVKSSPTRLARSGSAGTGGSATATDDATRGTYAASAVAPSADGQLADDTGGAAGDAGATPGPCAHAMQAQATVEDRRRITGLEYLTHRRPVHARSRDAPGAPLTSVTQHAVEKCLQRHEAPRRIQDASVFPAGDQRQGDVHTRALERVVEALALVRRHEAVFGAM
jgi:hypothetical protein